jgi:hypothetical protein
MATDDVSKIFISSTYMDLAQARKRVSEWLSGVFETELVIMETFGSDSAPPDVNSVRRVRECDLFVGIYAHRYGTADSTTRESITELELDEANRAFSAGTIRDILLYLIDTNVPWPDDLKEGSAEAIAGLARIREKAQQHTFTRFQRIDDLVFFIVRDVYRRVSQRMAFFTPSVRRQVLPRAKRLRQPLGMEFLTSVSRNYLVAREQDVERTLSQLKDNPVVLLLGDSGVGKTSLIHAGVIPRAVRIGWRAVYSRPLGFPCSDVGAQVFASVFRGRSTSRIGLVSLLGKAAEAVVEDTLLVIIDQFEDVLAAREKKEVEELLSALRAIRELASQSLRVLIGYRADLEGRLGEHWQLVSGSPQGLPRVYLGGINEDGAWLGVTRMAHALGVRLRLSRPEQERLKSDLLAASRAMGLSDVYPPYLQMLADHIWSSASKEGASYHFKAYQAVAGMEGVIGGYLSRLLEYAQDTGGHITLVLVSLVRSYGIKAQKSAAEIVADTGMSPEEVEESLEKLIDLRLVRHVEPSYEISHDYIARKIASELLDSEERDFKRFRELLTSKGAAFQTTKANITSEEMLMLYKYRARVMPSDVELRLILSSWIEGAGPALYWLLAAEPAKLAGWLRAEEASGDLEREQRASIVLLRHKLGEKPLTEEEYLAFRHYQLSAEFADLISQDALSVPAALIAYGLRHRRREVREACVAAVALRIRGGQWEWIDRLRGSSSVFLRRGYEALVLRDDVPAPGHDVPMTRALVEFSLLKRLSSARSSSEARRAYDAIRKARVRSHALRFGMALCCLRSGRLAMLLKKVRRATSDEAQTYLAAVSGAMTTADVGRLVSAYTCLNAKEGSRYERPVVSTRAHAVAAAILRCSSDQHLPRIRRAMKAIRLTPSSREIALALLTHGGGADLRLVLDRVGEARDAVDFGNHTELGQALQERMEGLHEGCPRFLTGLAQKAEFWEYFPARERATQARRSLLPIKCVDNRALYVRLVAHGLIGTVRVGQEDDLVALAGHNYRLIASGAAIRLVRLGGDGAFRKLSARVDAVLQEGRAGIFAVALRAAEMEFFGLTKAGPHGVTS